MGRLRRSPCRIQPSMQHIYSDPTFEMACDQFHLIADYLQIPDNLRERLMYPKRSVAVAVPVRMDDGSTKVFQGYRVQHHLSMGPTKGGTRFAPGVTSEKSLLCRCG